MWCMCVGECLPERPGSDPALLLSSFHRPLWLLPTWFGGSGCSCMAATEASSVHPALPHTYANIHNTWTNDYDSVPFLDFFSFFFLMRWGFITFNLFVDALISPAGCLQSRSRMPGRVKRSHFQVPPVCILRISVRLMEGHERKSSWASWAGYPTGGLGGGNKRHTEIPPRRGNRSSLVRLHESAARSTVTWREKNRGKKRGRKAVPSHPQARREGNGKLLLTHFIWQLVSCLWIGLTRCQATGAKFRRPHSCCIQRKEAARQKGPTWMVLYGPLLKPGAPVLLAGSSHDD